MRYTKFAIHNFKGIDKLTLSLDTHLHSDITVLVGLNESGKTTVLEALNFFFNGFSNLGKPDIKKEAYKLIPRKKSAMFSDKTSIVAEVKLNNEDEIAIKRAMKGSGVTLSGKIKKFTVTTEVVFGESQYVEEEGDSPYKLKNVWGITLKAREGNNKAYPLSHEDQHWQTTVKYIKDNLIPKVIYYPNFLYDFPDKIYTDSRYQPKDIEPDQQKACRHILQDILDKLSQSDDSLDDDSRYSLETHVTKRITSQDEQDKTALVSLLNKMSASITDSVISKWSAIFGKRENHETQVKITDGKDTFDNDSSTGVCPYLEIKLEQKEVFSINERSLGFRWFFLFLLFTEYRKKRATESGKTLFLIDEPASNLHSSMQKRLTESLQDIVDGSHIIYTTHSHHLINPKWLGSTFIVKNEAISYGYSEGSKSLLDMNTRSTDISVKEYKHFVSQNSQQKEHYRPILDTLDYAPSHLEMVEPILITEGKNDYYSLHYMFSVVLKNQIKKCEFRIYPGGGAGKNEQVLRLYTAWGKRFMVLHDADSAGKYGKGYYEKELGLALGNTRRY